MAKSTRSRPVRYSVLYLPTWRNNLRPARSPEKNFPPSSVEDAQKFLFFSTRWHHTCHWTTMWKLTEGPENDTIAVASREFFFSLLSQQELTVFFTLTVSTTTTTTGNTDSPFTRSPAATRRAFRRLSPGATKNVVSFCIKRNHWWFFTVVAVTLLCPQAKQFRFPRLRTS